MISLRWLWVLSSEMALEQGHRLVAWVACVVATVQAALVDASDAAAPGGAAALSFTP
ncbi:hypothetical protein [Streptomyces sp. NPDC004546]|uniref:hypothetical protein n=1 Tax=Streptomyces sp. NPDC004546 TaxID=3154282 RepID=UPI0033B3B874